MNALHIVAIGLIVLGWNSIFRLWKSGKVRVLLSKLGILLQKRFSPEDFPDPLPSMDHVDIHSLYKILERRMDYFDEQTSMPYICFSTVVDYMIKCMEHKIPDSDWSEEQKEMGKTLVLLMTDELTESVEEAACDRDSNNAVIWVPKTEIISDQ